VTVFFWWGAGGAGVEEADESLGEVLLAVFEAVE
jgi:hypothetical protein